MIDCDETHDPGLKSWVSSANSPDSEFPIQNLPFGVFCKDGSDRHVGVAIAERIVDLELAFNRGLLSGRAAEAAGSCRAGCLISLMALGRDYSAALRVELSRLLREGATRRAAVEDCLIPIREVQMQLPEPIRNFTDFATSINHVTNLGRVYRPESPLRLNFVYLPAAYHGRASSLAVGGTPCRRPNGQFKLPNEAAPQYGPTRQLDFELEVGFFVGPGTRLGEPMPLAQAEQHVFGMCLVNDWSARDFITWESQPLGPFLGKSFLTSVSPWIVTLEALAPFRTAAAARGTDAPPLLPYLNSEADRCHGGIDIALEVLLQSRPMRAANLPPVRIGAPRFAEHYWTVFQMLAHHGSNGCNLLPGDLMGSGTVSGTRGEELGCRLEAVATGAAPIKLPTGEERSFLEDGDEVVFRGRCERAGFQTIGFGDCRGIVEPAVAAH